MTYDFKKSLKKTCEGVRFLEDLQPATLVKNELLYWYFSRRRILRNTYFREHLSVAASRFAFMDLFKTYFLYFNLILILSSSLTLFC